MKNSFPCARCGRPNIANHNIVCGTPRAKKYTPKCTACGAAYHRKDSTICAKCARGPR